jgi:hypothetical protein
MLNLRRRAHAEESMLVTCVIYPVCVTIAAVVIIYLFAYLVLGRVKPRLVPADEWIPLECRTYTIHASALDQPTIDRVHDLLALHQYDIVRVLPRRFCGGVCTPYRTGIHEFLPLEAVLAPAFMHEDPGLITYTEKLLFGQIRIYEAHWMAFPCMRRQPKVWQIDTAEELPRALALLANATGPGVHLCPRVRQADAMLVINEAVAELLNSLPYRADAILGDYGIPCLEIGCR